MHRLCVSIVAALLVLTGCQKESTPKSEPPAKPWVKSEETKPSRPQPPEKVELPKPPEPKAIPSVSLSEEAKATNRVKVGDKLPGGELADLSGKTQAIEKLLGPKLTVLFFWTAENSYSVTELEDLQADVFQPMTAKGVHVVGINVDDDPQKARKAAEKAGAKFPILLDPGKKYFAKLATEKLLRTYLVDSKGVIRWFDVEYSRSTERDLLTGIGFILGGTGP